jgi:Cu-Zn family superoxide dismutase
MVILLTLFIGSRYYYLSPFYAKITNAIAVIHPTKNNSVSGVVTFTQTDKYVTVNAKLNGLNPGEHGFHIHEYGDCSCDDDVCAGDHFNPTHTPHGDNHSAKRHIGDLGNIIADEQGNCMIEYIDKQLSLNGPYSIIGRAIIVHKNKDNFVSQPTGNSGARIGCGVIGIKNKLLP